LDEASGKPRGNCCMKSGNHSINSIFSFAEV
jgi:hypothetical protein